MDWTFAYFLLALCPLMMIPAYFEYRKAKLLHLERMAAIEKGLLPSWANPDHLRSGLLWLVPGLGLVAFLWFANGDISSAWGGAGVLMACIGLAYVLFYLIESRKRA